MVQKVLDFLAVQIRLVLQQVPEVLLLINL
jgi:hypothetical protein